MFGRIHQWSHLGLGFPLWEYFKLLIQWGFFFCLLKVCLGFLLLIKLALEICIFGGIFPFHPKHLRVWPNALLMCLVWARTQGLAVEVWPGQGPGWPQGPAFISTRRGCPGEAQLLPWVWAFVLCFSATVWRCITSLAPVRRCIMSDYSS